MLYKKALFLWWKVHMNKQNCLSKTTLLLGDCKREYIGEGIVIRNIQDKILTNVIGIHIKETLLMR